MFISEIRREKLTLDAKKKKKKGATEAHKMELKTTNCLLNKSFLNYHLLINYNTDTGINEVKWVFSGITMASLNYHQGYLGLM